MFVQGSHTFAIFFTHALREWAWPRAHMNVTTFTRSAQNCYRGCLLVLWGPVALSPGIVRSFAVLHTEMLAFQEPKLDDKAMNVAVLCGDFLTIFFFLLGLWVLSRKKKRNNVIHRTPGST